MRVSVIIGIYTRKIPNALSEKPRYDAACQAHMVNLLVEARYRGRGYGNEGLLLLMKAAKENGIARLCDDIAVDNPSISLFLRVGFTEVWRNDA